MNLILILLLNLATCASIETYPVNSSTIKLPVETGNYDLEFIFNYTRYLHYTYHFRTFIVFSEKRDYNKPDHLIVRPLEAALLEEFENPIVVWGREGVAKLRYRIGSSNLVFVYISHVNDPILQVVSSALEGIRYLPTIFIHKRKHNVTPSWQEITSFFEWCWQQNMLNVALTYQLFKLHYIGNKIKVDIRNEVFNYTPFPKLEVFNVTEEVYRDQGKHFIKDSIKNVHDYRFTTPMFMDTPTVFFTQYERHYMSALHPHFITGTAGRIYHEYVHFVNGSLMLRPSHSISYLHFHNETLTYAARKLIDIGIHPYSSLLPNANLTDGSYPIGITNTCVIVPVQEEIAHGKYLIRVMPMFIWTAWIMELMSLSFVQCLHLGRLDIGGGILYSAGTLMAQPLNFREFRKRRVILRSLHLFVILLSVLVNSHFCAALTSILSTSLEGQQITSVKDLLQSGLRIMTNEFEKSVYFGQKLLPLELEPILLEVNESILQDHKDTMNTSYAYLVTSEEWKKYDFQQHLLRRPKFRIAHTKEMCTISQFSRFPLQWDSPFAMSLEKFLIYTMDTGLQKIWGDWSIYQATRMKLLIIWRPEEEEDLEKPFSIAHFETMLLVYIFFMMTASLSLIFEILWFKRNKIWGMFGLN